MNPNSEKDAATVFDRVLPSGQAGQTLMSMFAEAIREANIQGRHCWATRYTGDRVRLYVQHLIVFTLIDGEGWLALDDELIGEDEAETLSTAPSWRWPGPNEEYGAYKLVATRNGYYSPAENHQQLWPMLRRLHFSTIYWAARKTTMDPRTREGHSSGVLKYVRNNLGKHVPDPQY